MLPLIEKDENTYEAPKWGFHLISEIINGRLAMTALSIILIVEILTKESIIKILYLSN